MTRRVVFKVTCYVFGAYDKLARSLNRRRSKIPCLTGPVSRFCSDERERACRSPLRSKYSAGKISNAPVRTCQWKLNYFTNNGLFCKLIANRDELCSKRRIALRRHNCDGGAHFRVFAGEAFVKRITCFLRRILLPIQLSFGVLWTVC